MTCPVIPAAASEARYATMPPTSSTVPKPRSRRKNAGMGSPAASASTAAAKYGTVAVIAVAATGTTVLTVMPAFLSSSAHVRAMPTMPALAAA